MSSVSVYVEAQGSRPSISANLAEKNHKRLRKGKGKKQQPPKKQVISSIFNEQKRPEGKKKKKNSVKWMELKSGGIWGWTAAAAWTISSMVTFERHLTPNFPEHKSTKATWRKWHDAATSRWMRIFH